MKTNENTRSAHCAGCDAEFTSAFSSAYILGRLIEFSERHCTRCREVAEVRSEGQREGNTKKRDWNTICPPCYQNFDINLLPENSRIAAAEIIKWQYGTRGIGLIGKSRVGKTFILHHLVGLQYEAGLSVHIPTSVEFAYAVGSTGDERKKMIDKCLSVDILYIDDIGKEKITGRVESDLYMVIEHRRRWMLPMFTSVNSTGDELAGRMSDDAGVPIINRLKIDLCEFIAIKS